jgi:formylglycine-generating enzyme required for sulfatase activity
MSFAAPTITDVTARQRYPWNGKVDITYTVSGMNDLETFKKEYGLLALDLKVSATDCDSGVTNIATVLSLNGDLSLTDGTHSFTWDLMAQGLAILSTNVVFRVSCEPMPATYCVIDLSAGSTASYYPVTFLAAPPSGGFNVDAYKTSKLVLRRIEPGTFMMCGQYQTTLTKPYYIGIFEMTQRQYQLVMGKNPSKYKGNMRPVEQVNYNTTIRGSGLGTQWPTSSSVDENSFMGKLRSRTGLGFDLPTEAQWEYACRAGTTSNYNNGGDDVEDLKVLGRYGDTSGNLSDGNGGYTDAHTTVGSYQPNAWGLYDMHGNVFEKCLDWNWTPSNPQTDPVGGSSGPYRIVRGGSWYHKASNCTSSYRIISDPAYSTGSSSCGFRLARPIVATSQELACFGSSLPTIIGSTEMPVISPSGGVVTWPLSITITCATEGAIIRYTTDGTEPTAQSPLYRRFRISERSTIKAIASKNGITSEVAVAEFAAGQCANPIVSPSDGTTFDWAGQEVSIAWSGADGILRYTTDGSDPTAASQIYSGPFTIDESTIVKAKAFGDQFFDSAIVTANITRVWSYVATPTIMAASSFTGTKTDVALSCATDGAVIRYTLDGSTPNSGSTVYTGPFDVTGSCIVKAYATCFDYHDSAMATFSITKIWGIGDTLGVPDQVFTSGGDLPFVRVTDNTAPLGESMKSGAITHNQISTFSTTVMGAGTISFQWKASCEDSGGEYDWDHAEFWVDDTRIAQLDGETAWQTVTQAISGSGTHTLLWKYVKDNVESEGEDCCWVADYHWASAYTETQTTPAPVPYVWLRTYYPETPDEYDFYEAAAKEDAANGVNKVWECFVAGLVPTNATDVFRAVISMENGAPVVGWEPDLNEGGTKHERVYTVEGKENLADSWAPTNSASRFFRVKVEMP